ncbi:MAG: hypothetical protein HQK50_10360 [Oligoflexia bacterium]|nr:hypothetical protein [Oligoflexia bacterium]
MSKERFDVLSWLQKDSFGSFKTSPSFAQASENENVNMNNSSLEELFNTNPSSLSSFSNSNQNSYTHFPSTYSAQNIAKQVARASHPSLSPSSSSLPLSSQLTLDIDTTHAKDRLFTIYQTIHELLGDIIKQFQVSFSSFTKSMKQLIFDEFVTYAKAQKFTFIEIDNFLSFSHHLFDPESCYRDELNDFIALFCYRVAVLYILKIRLVVVLSKQLKLQFYSRDLANPSSFFSQIFKKGGSFEINNDAIQANHYTWFRPSGTNIAHANKIVPILDKVTIFEIHTLIHRKSSELDNHLDSVASLDRLSPQNIKISSDFLRLFLVNYNDWLNGNEEREKKNSFFPLSLPGHNRKLKIISCKYTGDNCDHFLVMNWYLENSPHLHKNKNLVYPHFVTDDTSCEKYWQFSYDLQLMTSLATLSEQYEVTPDVLISQVMNYHLSYGHENANHGRQMNLFAEVDPNINSKYERIVLNVTEFPKNNPHFFLFQKITSQEKFLSNNGQVYVFTTKKLFVPSQSDKFDQFLKIFKLDCVVNLEELVGSKEVAPYLYIFSKQQQQVTEDLPFDFISNINAEEKRISRNVNLDKDQNSYMNFQFIGQLDSCKSFVSINEALEKFYQNKPVESTPLYHLELPSNVTFEFYQDLISEGKPLHASNSKDPTKVTHPSFLKNLLKSCVPLDNFFTLEQIKDTETYFQQEHNTLQVNRDGLFQHILIVDLRNQSIPQIEIAPYPSFRGKMQEYGFALCAYFGIKSKIPHLNLNLFRDFFSTSIGKQMVQLSLAAGAINKIKARVASILIPKFLGKPQEIPSQYNQSLRFLALPEQELQKLSPNEINHSLQNAKSLLFSLAKEYPWPILGLLGHFYSNSNIFSSESNAEINYAHPLFLQSLLKLKTHAIYPANNDFFVEIVATSQEELSRTLTASKITPVAIASTTNNDNSSNDYCIELISGQKTAIRIHAEIESLRFMEFLLKSAEGHAISKVVMTLKLPTTVALKQLLHHFQQSNQMASSIVSECAMLMNQLVCDQIITQC